MAAGKLTLNLSVSGQTNSTLTSWEEAIVPNRLLQPYAYVFCSKFCERVEELHSKVLGARVVNERLSPCYPERGSEVLRYNSSPVRPASRELPQKNGGSSIWNCVRPSSVCNKQHQTPPIWSISLHHQQKPTLMACFAASMYSRCTWTSKKVQKSSTNRLKMHF